MAWEVSVSFEILHLTKCDACGRAYVEPMRYWVPGTVPVQPIIPPDWILAPNGQLFCSEHDVVVKFRPKPLSSDG